MDDRRIARLYLLLVVLTLSHTHHYQFQVPLWLEGAQARWRLKLWTRTPEAPLKINPQLEFSFPKMVDNRAQRPHLELAFKVNKG